MSDKVHYNERGYALCGKPSDQITFFESDVTCELCLNILDEKGKKSFS